MTSEEYVSDELVRFAEELADAASAIILQYWRKPVVVESKIEHGRPVPESPVTVADREAERAMRRMIEARFPDHGILGEEFGNVRLDAQHVWVLDPVDGTKSFITGKPLFGTLIALLFRGRPVLGVIEQCVLRERWVGANGSARLNGVLIHSRGATGLSEAMLYATTPHMFSPGLEEDHFGQIRSRVKRPLYGADCYAYALVASGFGADLVVEADLGVYDYCALVPVVEGAGGRISDWNGRPLTLQSANEARGRVVAAATEELWREAVEVLRDRPQTTPPHSASAGLASSVRAESTSDPRIGLSSGPSGLSVPSLLTGLVCGAAIMWFALRPKK